ncbi:MAG: Ig-like domain-containing protein [Candidatus Thermoplasmatota archaeon]
MNNNNCNKIIVFFISLLFISVSFLPITMTSNKIVSASNIEADDTTPPIVQIIKPMNAIYFFDKAIALYEFPLIIRMINIEVTATDNESGVNRVEFYIDGQFKGDDFSEPYTYYWNEFLSGEHTIKVIAYDNADNNASAEIDVFKWRYPPFTIIFLLIALILGLPWGIP